MNWIKGVILFAMGAFLLCSVVMAASTKIYKQVDEKGQITFTDSPPVEGTETVQEMKINVVGSGVAIDKNDVRQEEQTKEAIEAINQLSGAGGAGAAGLEVLDANNKPTDAKAVTQKYAVKITAPLPGQTFGPDTLEILVGVDVKPPLAKDDRLQVLVNGAPVLPPQKETGFKLPLLPAGEHDIQVQVVTKSGAIFDSNVVHIIQIRPSADQAH